MVLFVDAIERNINMNNGIFLGILEVISVFHKEILEMSKIKSPIKKHFKKRKLKRELYQIQKTIDKFGALNVLPMQELKSYLQYIYENYQNNRVFDHCIGINLIGNETYRAMFECILYRSEIKPDKVCVEVFIPSNTIRYHYIKNSIRTTTYAETNVQNLFIDHMKSEDEIYINARKTQDQKAKTISVFARTIQADIYELLQKKIRGEEELLNEF